MIIKLLKGSREINIPIYTKDVLNGEETLEETLLDINSKIKNKIDKNNPLFSNSVMVSDTKPDINCIWINSNDTSNEDRYLISKIENGEVQNVQIYTSMIKSVSEDKNLEEILLKLKEDIKNISLPTEFGFIDEYCDENIKPDYDNISNDITAINENITTIKSDINTTNAKVTALQTNKVDKTDFNRLYNYVIAEDDSTENLIHILVDGLTSISDIKEIIIIPKKNNTGAIKLKINDLDEVNIMSEIGELKAGDIKENIPITVVNGGTSFFIKGGQSFTGYGITSPLGEATEMNIYFSLEEPENKSGIWVKKDMKCKNISDGIFIDHEASSMYIKIGTANPNCDLLKTVFPSLNKVYITSCKVYDSNNEKLDDNLIYLGDGTAWNNI